MTIAVALFAGTAPLAGQATNDGARTDTITPNVPRTATPSDSVVAGGLYLFNPVVVTAARERATAPPVATITVTPEVVRVTPAENPYDLIRRVAGIEVHDQGQGPGFASNVVIRGFTADHSSDLLLVVDGVPLNLPVHGHVEGYADWNSIFPGATSSLRVIHGPASPLHGDFALAGAVELYTRADADGVEGSLSGNGYGDLSGWMTAGRRGPNGGGLVGLDLRRTEGWRENSNRRLGNALFRGWRAIGDARLEGGLSLNAADWSAPGFISLAQFEARDLQRFADRTDGGDQARAVANIRYATNLGADQFLQVMGWGLAAGLDTYLTTPGHTDALGNLYQTGENDRRWGAGTMVEYSWVPTWGEITFGASARTDAAEYDRNRTLNARPVMGEVAVDAEHTAFGGFFRWRGMVGDHIGLDLGGRVDHLRFRSMNRLDPDNLTIAGAELFAGEGMALFVMPSASVGSLPSAEGTTPSFHEVGPLGPLGEWVDGRTTVFSPKLGARLHLNDDWSLDASSSRGFRSAPGVLGDPTRPPLIAWANELGVDYGGSMIAGHLAVFRTDVSNERIQDPITLNISSAGSSVRQGFDGNLSVGLPGGVNLFARGTWTDAMLDGQYADAHHDHSVDGAEPDSVTAGDGDGQRVPGVASYYGSLSATAPVWRDLVARIEWGVTGPYVPIGEPDIETDAFSVFDLGLQIPVRDRLVVDVEIRNVLDHVYPEARSSGYINPGTPRMLGISVHYLGGLP